MPNLLKLLLDNITIFNLFFGNLNISDYLRNNNIEFIEKNSGLFIKNFEIDSLNLKDIHITSDFNLKFNLEIKKNNLDFNEFFLSKSENDQSYFLIHKRKLLDSYSYSVRYFINEKPYDLLVFEYPDFWEVVFKSCSSEPISRELIQKEISKSGILIQWGKEIYSENSIVSLDEFVSLLNSKYEYWNKEYYLKEQPINIKSPKNDGFTYSLEDNDELIWVVSKKELDKDSLLKYESTGLEVMIKGDLYKINGILELHCDEIIIIK